MEPGILSVMGKPKANLKMKIDKQKQLRILEIKNWIMKTNLPMLLLSGIGSALSLR